MVNEKRKQPFCLTLRLLPISKTLLNISVHFHNLVYSISITFYKIYKYIKISQTEKKLFNILMSCIAVYIYIYICIYIYNTKPLTFLQCLTLLDHKSYMTYSNCYIAFHWYSYFMITYFLTYFNILFHISNIWLLWNDIVWKTHWIKIIITDLTSNVITTQPRQVECV